MVVAHARDVQEKMTQHATTGVGHVVVGRMISTPREEHVKDPGDEEALLGQKTGDN